MKVYRSSLVKVFFKKGRGHVDSSVMEAWFYPAYNCNRSLASLEFQEIYCLSTGRSKKNHGDV